MTVNLSTYPANLNSSSHLAQGRFFKRGSLNFKIEFLNSNLVSKSKTLNAPNFWCHLDTFLKGHRLHASEKKQTIPTVPLPYSLRSITYTKTS